VLFFFGGVNVIVPWVWDDICIRNL